VLVAAKTTNEQPSFSPEGMKHIGLDAFNTLVMDPVTKFVRPFV
jgi:hypothetical protein